MVVALPFKAQKVSTSTDRETRAVPSVFGLDVRQAARTLYAAGFQVSIARGSDVRTRPAAGTMLRVGSTVQLEMPRITATAEVCAAEVALSSGELAAADQAAGQGGAGGQAAVVGHDGHVVALVHADGVGRARAGHGGGHGGFSYHGGASLLP